MRESRREQMCSMKLGCDKDFPYDANLEGITVEDHERNSFADGELVSFSGDPAEWKNISADLRRYFAEKLEQDSDSLNLRTSARTYDDAMTRYRIYLCISRSYVSVDVYFKTKNCSIFSITCVVYKSEVVPDPECRSRLR